MKYLTERLREPSTWAGIAAVTAGFGLPMDPGIWQNVAQAGMAASGLLAVLMKERTER